MSAFVGFVLLACGIPSLAGSLVGLRVAEGRAEEIVFGAVVVLAAAAVTAGGLLIS